jgi:hypothetical protein
MTYAEQRNKGWPVSASDKRALPRTYATFVM